MPAPDLLSLVLEVEALAKPPAERPLPTWWGRAAMSLLLDTVRASNPRLAESLHEENQPRPFTCSTLGAAAARERPGWGAPLRRGVEAGKLYRLRITALHKELAASLLEASANGPLSVGKTIELDYLPFRIGAVHTGGEAGGVAGEGSGPLREASGPLREVSGPLKEASGPLKEASGPLKEASGTPWAAQTTFQELSAPYLLGMQPAPRRLKLLLASPTTFKGSGREFPFPLPELVFNSLVEKWNTWAPVAFPPEARRYAAECLAASRYRLWTLPVHTQPQARHIGAMGELTCVTMNYDRYWMSVIAVLAEFARFAGVGAVTSMGMGQCRRLAELDLPGEVKDERVS
jgi:CRISPR-associated endoribonuclease Cas6